MGPLTLNHYLVLGAVLFSISVVGIFLNRRNIIILLMAIELMLRAVSRQRDSKRGPVSPAVPFRRRFARNIP